MDSPPSDPDTEGGRGRRRRWLMVAIAVVFVAAAAGYGAWWLLVARFYVATDDAYVHGNLVYLMPRVSGTVTSVYTDDTQLVRRGQTLVTLDPTTARIALGRAEANLADTVRTVRSLYQQLAEQRATVALHAAQLAKAQRDYRRNQRLVKSGSVSQQQYQDSQTALDTARASERAARHRLAELRAATDNTVLRNHPKVLLAEAGVRDAWFALYRHTLVAPATGFVAQRSVQIGQRIKPGDRLLAIVPLNQVWVEANFKETELASMRIGQPVTLTADFYGDDITYHGSVAGISPGTGSTFELLPPQNATGNWIKVVRRVPVRIALDPDELKQQPLRLGLSMHASVDVRNTSGPTLATAPAVGPVYSTDVYKTSEQPLRALIDGIVDANNNDRAVDRGD